MQRTQKQFTFWSVWNCFWLAYDAIFAGVAFAAGDVVWGGIFIVLGLLMAFLQVLNVKSRDRAKQVELNRTRGF